MGKTHYYKGIQLPQLRGFCSVAVNGSFTAAARALGLSKPTVWQQVRALERELKVVLLRPGKHGIELTPEGQLLLKLIQPHLTGLDSLARLFETQRAELQQWLAVISTPYLMAHRLPPVVQEYTQTHPSVRLHLQTELTTEGVIALVDQRRADLGIVPYHPAEVRNINLEYEPLGKLTFMLLTAAKHPLAQKKRVTAQDLVSFPIIKGAGYNRDAMDKVLRRHNLTDRLHVVLESGSTDIVLQYVAMGIGVAVLYIGDLKPHAHLKLHARPFDPEETDPLVVALMYRKGAHLPEHVEAFCRLVRRHLT
jgi:DNA-binding transcriptional LysR family regulator